MDTAAPPRQLQQRIKDSLGRLEKDKDLWVSTANLDGVPCLVPLSFLWNGRILYIATAGKNPTAQNIDSTGLARVILGHTRDVVLIDTRGQRMTEAEATAECADAYNEKCGWDPRKSRNYFFFRLEPDRAEAWRELNEHEDREIMADGQWRTANG